MKFTFLEDKLSQRVPNLKGDLLVIRSTLSVKRSDFGNHSGSGGNKVSDTMS